MGKMLRMKTIKSRLDAGLSYTEFSYQTLQAYDWYILSKKYGCRFQLGGYDQLGHLDFGAHYIKKMTSQSGKGAFAAGVCFPILADSTGNKLGKSEGGGALWLDAKKTSPYHFYQFFAQLHDDKAEELLLLFSVREIEELTELLQNHRNNLGKWIAQRELASEITRIVHGTEGLDAAMRCTKAMFGGKKADLTGLSRDEILQMFKIPLEVKEAEVKNVQLTENNTSFPGQNTRRARGQNKNRQNERTSPDAKRSVFSERREKERPVRTHMQRSNSQCR